MMKLALIAILLVLSNFYSAEALDLPLKRRRRYDLTSLHRSAFLHSSPSSSSLPPSLSLLASKEFPVISHHDMLYTITVSLGTPKTDFNVVLDTGSGDFWVLSAQSSGEKFDYLNFYDHDASSSYTAEGTRFAIKYGKGSASGYRSTDVFALGELSMANTLFSEAVNYTAEFTDNQAGEAVDGVLGLATYFVSSIQTPTIIDQLHARGLIHSRMFSFDLTSDAAQARGSRFILGDPDMSLAPHGLTWLRVVSTAMWDTLMDGMYIDGQRVNNLCSSPRCVALFDTGTSFIGIPNDLWLSVISFIIRERDDCVVNQEAGTVQCKIFQPETQTLDYSKLPIIAFGFNRIPFTLSPQQYIVGNTILLVRLPKEVPEFIMGDVFIDHYYTVFDGDSRYIGIAIGDNVSIWSWGVALLAALAVSGGIGIGFLLVQRRHARGIVGFGAARSHTAAADGPGSGIGGAGAGVGYRMSSSRGHRLGGNPSGLQPVPLDER